MTIPRLPKETDLAYHAKVLFLQMGAERTLIRVVKALQAENAADSTCRKKSIHTYDGNVDRWCSRFEWRNLAIKYDQELAEEAARQNQVQYLKDLEDHRNRYRKIGDEVFKVSRAYLGKMIQRLQTMTDDDVDPAKFMEDLVKVTRTITASADLEAHTLQLDKLFPLLDKADKKQPEDAD